MDLLAAIDRLDDLVHGAPGIPLSRDVRLQREPLQEAVAAVRRAIDAEFGLMTGGDPAATTMKRATQELEELARTAPAVALIGGVRIRRDLAFGLLDELRKAVPAEIIARDGSPARDARLAAVDALDHALRHARPIPLTPEVRLEADELARRLADLQQAFAGATRAPASLDAIGWLVARAKPVPLTTQVRVDRSSVLDQLDALRRLRDAR